MDRNGLDKPAISLWSAVHGAKRKLLLFHSGHPDFSTDIRLEPCRSFAIVVLDRWKVEQWRGSNCKHFLEQCLHSVRKASKNVSTEIFVVDNNSVDGSVNMVKEKFPEVQLIENKKNCIDQDTGKVLFSIVDYHYRASTSVMMCKYLLVWRSVSCFKMESLDEFRLHTIAVNSLLPLRSNVFFLVEF